VATLKAQPLTFKYFDFLKTNLTLNFRSISSSSLPNPESFPTLLALSSTSYALLARAVTEVLRRFSWTKFNLWWDKNPDPIQQGVDVICNFILGVVQTQARDLNVVVRYFDSSKVETLRSVVEESKKHSTGM
jgi:hypothetical protein